MIQAQLPSADRASPGTLASLFRRVISHAYFPVALLILANLVIGSLIVTDYGESWDEYRRYGQAWRSLRSYEDSDLVQGDEKGPFYGMLARIGAERIRRFRDDWSSMEAWHFMHFLSFQMGLFFFYALCLRLADKWVTLASTALFATQPLLWGHAFINPKDIPFMSFFLASVACGLWMVETATEKRAAKTTDEFEFWSAWAQLEPRSRSRLRRILGLCLGSLMVLLLLGVFVRQPLAALINLAYQAGPDSPLGSLFSRVAANKESIPAETYVQKGVLLYRRIASYGASFLVLAGAVLASRALPNGFLIRMARQVWPATKLILAVGLAGLFLGLCSSVRVLGPASGALVGIYFLLKAGRRSIPLLSIYLLIAAMVTYLTWPGLWNAPLTEYLNKLTKSAEFPWEGPVLFGGTFYPSEHLPPLYLPGLMALQFTEAAILLFVLGLAVAGYRLVEGSIEGARMAVIAAWFFIPLALAIVTRPTTYDNFRHFLFIIPPLFLFAGLGLQALYDRLKRASWRGLLLAAAILPGLFWLFRLHPYQYVYYNQLAGGVSGAFRNYEMDYWLTSYREATRYLNENAPGGSQVVVWGAAHLVKRYAREDISILELQEAIQDETFVPDYAVLPSRENADLQLYREGEEVFQVAREGAVFTVVKQLKEQVPGRAPGQ